MDLESPLSDDLLCQPAISVAEAQARSAEMHKPIYGTLPFPARVKYDDCCPHGVCKHDDAPAYAMAASMVKAFFSARHKPALLDAYLFTALGLQPQVVLVALSVLAPQKFCIFVKCELSAGLYTWNDIEQQQELPWRFRLDCNGAHLNFIRTMAFFKEGRATKL